MQRVYMHRAWRQGVRQARAASSASSVPSSGDNSSLMMFLFGSAFGAGALAMLGRNGGSAKERDQQRQISDLEGKLRVAQMSSSKTDELRLLSDDFLQCTKGSEQLTGDLEHMASRLQATQSELISSKKRMEELTQQNESYLMDVTDRIQAKVQAGKSSSVGFVTEGGDLVSFRRTGDGSISVTVGSKQAGNLSSDVPYDEKSGTVTVGSSAIVLPKDRREILVGQLANLADTAGLRHNLVGSAVSFTDADGDRIKFLTQQGKLVVEMKGGLVAPDGKLAYDKATRKLVCGGAGSCTLSPDAEESILRRLKRLAEKASFPNDL